MKLARINRAPTAIAAIAWAERGLREARRDLPNEGLDTRVRRPGRASAGATALVERWLRRRQATCLERTLLLQAWYLALGQPHDVLIGVADASETVIAHAWLDHEDSLDHAEITRVHPRHA